ncbi:MAG: hypothetical protein KC486_09805, partial [Myxococcales bacterium]|nr:hypothetical protein [Myxococcales bacterium]
AAHLQATKAADDSVELGVGHGLLAAGRTSSARHRIAETAPVVVRSASLRAIAWHHAKRALLLQAAPKAHHNP